MRKLTILHCSFACNFTRNAAKVFIAILAGSHAETLGRAPYAPAGWRPRQPFTLPNEYLTPLGTAVEISKARVLHAGTFSEPQESLPPAAQYGPPADGSFRIDYPEEEEDDTTTTELPANIREGRYYVVSPDNKLQRVLYRTKDGAGNGFTAQLRYSSVGQLQDPVYKYDQAGHLERVLK